MQGRKRERGRGKHASRYGKSGTSFLDEENSFRAVTATQKREEKGGGKHAAISPLFGCRGGNKCARLILPQSADAVFAKIYVGSETCARWPIRRKLRREEEPSFLPVLSSPTTSTIRFPSIILLYSISNHLERGGRMSLGEEKSGLREITLSLPHIL